MAVLPLIPQRPTLGDPVPQLRGPVTRPTCHSTRPCGVETRIAFPCSSGSRVEVSLGTKTAQAHSGRARKGHARRRALAARAQREPALEAQVCREAQENARAGTGVASPPDVNTRPGTGTPLEPPRSSHGVVATGRGPQASGDSRGRVQGFLEESLPLASPDADAWASELPGSAAALAFEGERFRVPGGGVQGGKGEGEREGEGEGGGANRAVRTSPLRVLLIDNYDSYTYNLYHLIAVCNFGVPPVVLRNDDLSWDTLRPLLVEPCAHRAQQHTPGSAGAAEAPPAGREAGSSSGWCSEYLFDCVVISPGPGSPAIASDIGVCLDVLQHCTYLPVLGVCMGHQALGVASGARVGLAPQPVHGLLSPVAHSGHELFHGIPSGEAFQVVRYHSLVVDPSSLPSHLEAIGWTAHHGEALDNTDDGTDHASSATAASGQTSSSLGISAHRGPASSVVDDGNVTPAQEGVVRAETQEQQSGAGPSREGASEGNGAAQRTPTGDAGAAEAGPRSEGGPERIIMALAHRELPHWGVQFHPESIETRYGPQLVSNFLDLAAGFWEQGRPAGAPAAAAGEGQGPQVTVSFGPHLLDLPGKVSGQLDALLAASARSSPHQALCLGTAPFIPAEEAPLAPRNTQGALGVYPAQGAGYTQGNAQGRTDGCTQGEPRDASQSEGLLPGSAPLGRPRTAGHEGVARGASTWEAPHSEPRQPPAGGQLSLHWEKVPGALRGMPGGSAWLFQVLFGSSEAEARDTFWLDSSTAEQGGAAAPREQPTADLAAQDCSWSSSSASTGNGSSTSNSSSASTGGSRSSSSTSGHGSTCREGGVGGASCGDLDRWDRDSSMGGGKGDNEVPLAGPAQPRPRFSFMGGVGGRLWRKVVYHLSESGGELQLTDHRGEAVTAGARGAEGGIFEHLEKVLEDMQLPADAGAELPFDFCGGFVGYLGYELKAESGGQRSRHQSPHPDAFFFLADRFLAVDHSTGDLYVLGVGEGEGEEGGNAEGEEGGNVEEGEEGGNAGEGLPPSTHSGESSEEEGAACASEARIVPALVHSGVGPSVRHSIGRNRKAEAGGSTPLWHRLGGVGSTGEWVRLLAGELRAKIANANPGTVGSRGGGTHLGGQASELVGQGLGGEPGGTGSALPPLGQREEQREEGAQRPQNGGAREHTGDCAQLSPRTGQDEYEAAVRECQQHIRVGESYELCLTTQLEGGAGAGQGGQLGCARPQDALDFYLTLRSVSPAPYGAWLSGQYRRTRHDSPASPQAQEGVTGGVLPGEALAGGENPVRAEEEEESVVLCCSSPERFLRLDARRVLEAKPIKGTRPRGATPEEDRALAEALRTDVKDRAENLMIVDLLRNDLGRVSDIGTVGVPSLMAVESYAFVHQLVSTVRSRLAPGISPVAAVQAAFPGGSMTGAPKIRSMQILDEVEGCARGPYSGVLGYFSLSHAFSFNIVIRSAVLSKKTISVGAGGAVIALSNPTAEFREMRLKARSVEKALTLLQPADQGTHSPQQGTHVA